MEPTFGHPLWISSGVVLVIAGFLLFHWARLLGARDQIANAQRETSAGQILKGKKTSKSSAAGNFRRAISQFFGIVAFLMIIAGLMAIFLGIFYVVS